MNEEQRETAWNFLVYELERSAQLDIDYMTLGTFYEAWMKGSVSIGYSDQSHIVRIGEGIQALWKYNPYSCVGIMNILTEGHPFFRVVEQNGTLGIEIVDMKPRGGNVTQLQGRVAEAANDALYAYAKVA